MRVIWVLENIEEDKSFYGKLNILLLLASVRLWKKHNPLDNCVLYADAMTLDLLGELQVDTLWNEVIEYKGTRQINRSVFWAASKLQVLSEQTEPVILMDNDTLVFKPIKEFLDKDTHYVCNLEQGQGYYPSTVDKYVRQLSYRTRWKTESVNVSFLYLPDPAFIKLYSNMSLDFMEEFTKMKAPNPQYLIFSEQMLLRHLFDRENIKFKSLISTYWDCQAWGWGEDHDKGIWPYRDSVTNFKHYGPEKTLIIQNKAYSTYKEETEMLLNCINIPNLDLSNIHKK